eukprot:590574-Amorphochlora_amoeboformis.AAC.1
MKRESEREERKDRCIDRGRYQEIYKIEREREGRKEGEKREKERKERAREDKEIYRTQAERGTQTGEGCIMRSPSQP